MDIGEAQKTAYSEEGRTAARGMMTSPAAIVPLPLHVAKNHREVVLLWHTATTPPPRLAFAML